MSHMCQAKRRSVRALRGIDRLRLMDVAMKKDGLESLGGQGIPDMAGDGDGTMAPSRTSDADIQVAAVVPLE